MRAILTLCVLAGCGGGDSGPAIEGMWYAAPGGPCASMFDFDSGRYAYLELCDLVDGSVGAEGERGEYELDGRTVTLIPMRTTCPDRPGEPVDLQWSVRRDSLTLGNDAGAVVYDRFEDDSEDSGGGGVVVFGCAGEERFTESPWMDI